MIVAVNTKCPGKNHSNFQENLVYGLFTRLAEKHLQHTFILIFEESQIPAVPFSKNIIPLVVRPLPRYVWRWKYWYNYTLPRALKKYDPDIFISEGICSLRMKIPQCLLMNDLLFLSKPGLMKKSRMLFLRNYTGKFLQKARVTITFSEWCKKELLANYKVDKAKLEVVKTVVDEIFRPASPAEKEMIKDQYAGGNEYFLIPPGYSQQEIVSSLKAFSLFKKKLKSSMQLLVVTDDPKNNEILLQHLRWFKFRDEVQLLHNINLTEKARVTAGAYTTLYLGQMDCCGGALLEPMKCGVPVITVDSAAMLDITGGSSLYADTNDFKDIAEKMITLYKDEKARKELVKKAIEHVKKYNPIADLELLWATIVKTTA